MKNRKYLLVIMLSLSLLLSSCSAKESGNRETSLDGMQVESVQKQNYKSDRNQRNESTQKNVEGSAAATEVIPQEAAATEADINAADDAYEYANREKKIVKEMSIDGVTENLGKITNELETYLNRAGGFIEEKNILRANKTRKNTDDTAYYLIRIPKENYDDMHKWLLERMTISSLSNRQTDLTSQYYDQEKELASLKRTEVRYLKRVEEATELSDIIAFERELAVIREDIESVDGTLKNIDDSSAFSTIYLNIREVLDEEIVISDEDPFGVRITKRFQASWLFTKNVVGNGLVFLSGAIIPIILIGVLLIPFRYMYQKRKTNTKEN